MTAPIRVPVRVAARAAAARLDAEYGPGLVADVETALNAADPARRPDQYIDPVAMGSLIVGIATLAWTIYNDLKKKTPDPPSETVVRAVRVELREQGDAVAETITEIVVAEIVRTERETP